MNTKNFTTNKLYVAAVMLLFLLISFFFDKGLSIGSCLILVLSGIAFFVLYKLGFRDKKMYLLFLIALAMHLAPTLLMNYYPHVFPYSASGPGADYALYQNSAVEFFQCFRQGIFSIKDIVSKYPDIYMWHFYPALVGALYALTMPEQIIALMLNVWLAALFVTLVYLIILEIGGSKKNAFITGLIATVYPSLILYSSLLYKDPLELCLSFIAILLIIKLIKKFTFWQFTILYLLLIPITNLRFYLGYALMLTFVICWFLFCKNVEFKKRIIYIAIIIFLFGFLPQISVNPSQGYGGINSFGLLKPNAIAHVRELNSRNEDFLIPIKIVANSPINNLKNFIESFIYIILGPFPWHITKLSHAVTLFESIPWYFLLYFVIKGIIRNIKERNTSASPLIVFSIIFLSVISIFDSFFQLAMRIRIPAVICLLCFLSFGISENYIKNIGDYINNKLKTL